MPNPLTHLPPDQPLSRKELLYHLKWSRTTLWRRERDGLPVVGGTIAVRDLETWLDQWARRPEEEQLA